MKKIVSIIFIYIFLNFIITNVAFVYSCNSIPNKIDPELERPFEGWDNEFVDDRSDIQKKSQKDIDLNVSANFLNNKKVFLIGLDGVDTNIYTDFIKNSKSVFYRENKIQTWESKRGWRNIFYGNVKQEGKGLFEMFASLNQKDYIAKIHEVSNWSMFKWSLLKPNDKNCASSRIACIPLENLKKDNFYNEFHSDPKFNTNTTIEESNLVFDWGKNKIENNYLDYNFNFFHDSTADDLGHAGNGYSSKVMNHILKKRYKELLENYFNNHLFNNEDTLILVTTDHGRNKDGMNHNDSVSEPQVRTSFIDSNKNLDDILERKYENIYDIKEVIYKWVTNN